MPNYSPPPPPPQNCWFLCHPGIRCQLETGIGSAVGSPDVLFQLLRLSPSASSPAHRSWPPSHSLQNRALDLESQRLSFQTQSITCLGHPTCGTLSKSLCLAESQFPCLGWGDSCILTSLRQFCDNLVTTKAINVNICECALSTTFSKLHWLNLNSLFFIYLHLTSHLKNNSILLSLTN